MKIAIINGPNLNLLGKREPEIYGNEAIENLLNQLEKQFPRITFHYFQTNVEGELVNELQRVGFSFDGIVLNPAAYTHTSVAIADAVAAISAPVIEVHISNIYSREDFRKISFVSPNAIGVISGLGLKGYELAVEYLITKLSK
ncbi:MAG: type II 3-dehydroquinate dehydratase [Chitinophagaceae bacterium]|nr:type II 3-dehydroquinate dehydratase [Chitinophagaceae bacterium]MBK9958179.1 type II 3-dehydroquinate dehydratase [Chitinophagaceae bacterium]MBL0254548.1 type II 3-dehydroquinate dehydratase [Chitinophagaceae bacterium]